LLFDLRPRLTRALAGGPDLVIWSCALGMICSWQAAAPSRLLAIRPMQWIGERSYSVYLLHPFVIFWLIKAGAYAPRSTRRWHPGSGIDRVSPVPHSISPWCCLRQR
jgi:peptidoglycan/LPS O-acetylase OafA/YrhL